MDLHDRYPALSDLRNRARRRLPRFIWEYLDSGTGDEAAKRRNRAELDKVLLNPAILKGAFDTDLSVSMMGRDYPLPVGIAPVGMSGLVWPRAEFLLADAAKAENIPYALSTVASQTPEAVGPHVGDQGWFQLYPPKDVDIRKDMLRRVREAGFHTLVLTVDVPVASRRERQVRSGLTTPPRITPHIAFQAAQCPSWSLGILQNGMPRLRFVESYSGDMAKSRLPQNAHIGYLLRTSPDWEYLKWLREHWDGSLVVKGVLLADDAKTLVNEGVDAIWISNHAGRQFDGAPATISALPTIRQSVGPECPIIIDGGFETGLDILRAIALGADFVMLGRAWHYALAALGQAGPAHLADILRADLKANMGQMGIAALTQARGRVIAPTR